ncbi:MAG: signal peptidase I, partial [Oscillospiraceae bacterium]|nr:signal peptidase I [Oscillospiraceae bacterium]
MKRNNRSDPPRKGTLSSTTVILLDVVFALVLLGALVLFYRSFLFSRVQGNSMEPTYRNSDFLLCTRASSADRFDIVCFRARENQLGDRETQTSLRRVIGLPGETVTILEDGTVAVNGQVLEEPYLAEDGPEGTYLPEGQNSLTLGADEYYVLGDFRKGSLDSRFYGAVAEDAILGRALANPNILV